MNYFVDSSDLVSLRNLLADPELESDTRKARRAMKQVVQISSGVESCDSLLSSVVKLLGHCDLVVKKMVCHFITRHCSQSEVVMLAVNSLLKDCSDANPMVRGLALRTLCSLQQEMLAEYCMDPVIRGLKDKSAYVRRIAATSCVKIHQTCPQNCRDYGLVNGLYSMVRDTDPIVVTNSLSAIEEILSSEGGVVINRNIAYHLLNRLPTLTEWGIVLTFSLLKRYKPKTEEETFDIMNVIDNYIKHNNCAVVTGCLQLFLHLINDLPHLKNEVYKRAKGQILHFLSSDNHELVHSLLEFLEEIISKDCGVFADHYKVFFCRYNEPLYVKTLKLKLLTQLTMDDNCKEILDDLTMHCTDISAEVGHSAISAIGKIYLKLANQREICIKKLLELLTLKTENVISSVLHVLKTLNLTETTSSANLIKIMACIPDLTDQLNKTEGVCALLWLIGEYGEHLEESPYILEEFITKIQEEQNVKVWLLLLTAAVKQFLMRPAECQDLLGSMFELCLQSDNVDIRDRAVFYYSLLKLDIRDAKFVLGQTEND